jgi:hypothetical protein
MKAETPNLLVRLRRNGDDGEALYDGRLNEGNYGGIAILHHISPHDFADLLFSDGRPNRELCAALVRRYQYWGSECELLLERPWLDALKQELDDRASKLGPPFDRVLSDAFSKTFDEISGILSSMAQRCKSPTPAPTTAPAAAYTPG